MKPSPYTATVLEDVAVECLRLFELHGDQSALADGTGPETCPLLDLVTGSAGSVAAADLAGAAIAATDRAAADGRATFAHVLLEELFEALSSADPSRLRGELVQVAAVAVQWVEVLDRREPRCRTCGCTEDLACLGGCGWAPQDGGGPVCTRCAGLEARHLSVGSASVEADPSVLVPGRGVL